MHAKNHLGNPGEEVVSLLFSRKIDDTYRFTTKFRGEKGPLLDFMVSLLDPVRVAGNTVLSSFYELKRPPRRFLSGLVSWRNTGLQR